MLGSMAVSAASNSRLFAAPLHSAKAMAGHQQQATDQRQKLERFAPTPTEPVAATIEGGTGAKPAPDGIVAAALSWEAEPRGLNFATVAEMSLPWLTPT